MKTLFYQVILFAALPVFFVSCNDDDKAPLTFYDDYYEVQVGKEIYVSPKTGNGKYLFEIENPLVCYAEMEYGWSNPENGFNLKGIITGETKLHVTDEKTGETNVLHVRVTDVYECIVPTSDFNESVYPAFSNTTYVALVNNKARDAYFMAREAISLTDYVMVLQQKGSYAFSKENDDYYLTLSYVTDSEGQLSDIAVPATPHKFLIDSIGGYVFHRLDLNLNLGFDTPPLANDDKAEVRIALREVGTEEKAIFYLEYGQLPTGILD